MDVKIQCHLHKYNQELNISSCDLHIINGIIKHTTKFNTPVKTDIYKNEGTLCVMRDDDCLEYEEYYDRKQILCSIVNLHRDTSLDIVYTCVRNIITLFQTLRENNCAILNKDKKKISAQKICENLLHFAITHSDRPTVVFTQKYLIVRNKKTSVNILPKVLLFFLCRPTSTIQENCGNGRCILRKQVSKFIHIPSDELHRALCSGLNAESVKEIFMT